MILITLLRPENRWDEHFCTKERASRFAGLVTFPASSQATGPPPEDYGGLALQYNAIHIVRKQSPRYTYSHFTHHHHNQLGRHHDPVRAMVLTYMSRASINVDFFFFEKKKKGTIGSWANGNDRSPATDTWHRCKIPGDGPEKSDRIFYSSPYLFAWGIFCLS
jgi:hypothetical protein